MPNVSVIVPVYKVEKYLQRCIDSLLNQTYSDFEVILVEDGSPDNCPEICDCVCKIDSRFIVIHKKNGGLSDARNTGLSVATGCFITFVDSDDMIAPNYLSILVDVQESTEADIVFSDKYTVFSKSVECQSALLGEIVNCNAEDALCRIFCKTGRWEACGSLIRKEILDGESFPKGMLYEDLALMTKLVLKTKQCVFINSAIYYYFQREDSIMGKSSSKVKTDLVVICDNLIQEIMKNDMVDEKKYAIILGILMELASRIDLAQNNKKQNVEFIQRGRGLLRQCWLSMRGLRYVKEYDFKRKFYCCSFAFEIDCIWKPIYRLKGYVRKRKN